MPLSLRYLQDGTDVDTGRRIDELKIASTADGEHQVAAMRCGEDVFVVMKVDGAKLTEARRQAIADSGGRVLASLLDDSGLREPIDTWSGEGAPIEDAPC